MFLDPIFVAMYDVFDTYFSWHYICYNYCGPVYIKLNFEALRQCEPPSVFASCHISVVSVDHYVIQGLKQWLKIAVIHS